MQKKKSEKHLVKQILSQVQLKNAFVTDAEFNIELYLRKINVLESQEESFLDTFTILA